VDDAEAPVVLSGADRAPGGKWLPLQVRIGGPAAIERRGVG